MWDLCMTIGAMRFSRLGQITFLSFICAGLLCYRQAYAGAEAPIYSGRDVTGGVVVNINSDELIVDERNGKQRYFSRTYGVARPDTTVTIDGSTARFDDIKLGMRVQIVFYTTVNGKKNRGTAAEPLPINSVKAMSNSPEKPKP